MIRRALFATIPSLAALLPLRAHARSADRETKPQTWRASFDRLHVASGERAEQIASFEPYAQTFPREEPPYLEALQWSFLVDGRYVVWVVVHPSHHRVYLAMDGLAAASP